VKAVLSIPIAAAILCCANIAAADPWGCKVFDAIRDIDCPPHPDYVLKRVYFFCGENPRSQFRRASGDCRREGIAFNLRKFSYHGLPAVTWNVEGRKSRAVLATGCYIGLTKSISFCTFIALAGCRMGLSVGCSAADVGCAATGAVVEGIIRVCVLEV